MENVTSEGGVSNSWKLMRTNRVLEKWLADEKSYYNSHSDLLF
jgi:hypothetical protein